MTPETPIADANESGGEADIQLRTEALCKMILSSLTHTPNTDRAITYLESLMYSGPDQVPSDNKLEDYLELLGDYFHTNVKASDQEAGIVRQSKRRALGLVASVALSSNFNSEVRLKALDELGEALGVTEKYSSSEDGHHVYVIDHIVSIGDSFGDEDMKATAVSLLGRYTHRIPELLPSAPPYFNPEARQNALSGMALIAATSDSDELITGVIDSIAGTDLRNLSGHETEFGIYVLVGLASAKNESRYLLQTVDLLGKLVNSKKVISYGDYKAARTARDRIGFLASLEKADRAVIGQAQLHLINSLKVGDVYGDDDNGIHMLSLLNLFLLADTDTTMVLKAFREYAKRPVAQAHTYGDKSCRNAQKFAVNVMADLAVRFGNPDIGMDVLYHLKDILLTRQTGPVISDALEAINRVFQAASQIGPKRIALEVLGEYARSPIQVKTPSNVIEHDRALQLLTIIGEETAVTNLKIDAIDQLAKSLETPYPYKKHWDSTTHHIAVRGIKQIAYSGDARTISRAIQLLKAYVERTDKIAIPGAQLVAREYIESVGSASTPVQPAKPNQS